VAKGSVTLAGHFVPGTKVEIYERVGDISDRDSTDKPVKKATVNKSAEVNVSGLDAGKGYWVIGEVEGVGTRSVRVTAKPDSPQAARALQESGPAGKPARRVDSPSAGPEVVQGARSTVTARSTNPGKKPKSDRSEGSQLDSRPQPKAKSTARGKGPTPKGDKKAESPNTRSDALPDSQAKKDDKASGIRKLRR